MATHSKSPKKQKPSKSRPVSTSVISQPVPVDSESSSLASLSAFSPDGKWFALLSLAVDKHRLRVFDAENSGGGKVVAEYVLQVSIVTSLQWGKVVMGDENSHHDIESEKKGKSKKRKRNQEVKADARPTTQVIILGLANGTITFFSPTHGNTVITLSHATSTSSVSAALMDDDQRHVWTAGADGTIRLWDTQDTQSTPLTYSTKSEDNRIPYSTLLLRPHSVIDEDSHNRQILAANHGIELLGLKIEEAIMGGTSAPKKTKRLAKFTGHASTVSSIQWVPLEDPNSPPEIFITSAERDRFVQGWELPSSSSSEGKILFSAAVDGPVRKVQLNSDGRLFLVVSSTGVICVFTTPSMASVSSSSLEPTSVVNVTISKGKTADAIEVLDAVFSSEIEGNLRIACLVEGARPIFQTAQIIDDSSELLQRVNVKISRSSIPKSDDLLTLPQRYRERDGVTLGSGSGLPEDQDARMDDVEGARAEGTLDTEMAELTLGQRLKAITGEDIHGSSSDETESAAGKKRRKKRGPGGDRIEVPTESLSRTLIQALHSGDTKLLEACLRHSDPALIKNTVNRVPQQLSVPLLTACVERLGRGRGGNTGRGRGAAASAQRGTTMVGWIRAVLVVHSGYLMTLPNLVARLSALHTTLTSRLALQERLLLLNGRLDLALAQVELRWSKSSGVSSLSEGNKSRKADENVTKYVEGESEDEEEMQVEVDNDSEDGSIEEIGLKGTSDADTAEEESEEEEDEDEELSEDEDKASEDEEDEDDEEEDSDASGGGPKLNGFIDDEAEEWSGSDEEEDDE